MSVNDEITTRTGLKLKVEKTEINGQIQVFFRTEAARKFLLHWGLRRDGDSSWRVPPQSSWPEATKATPQGALESSFTNQNGENRLEIRLDKTADFSSIDFVLFFPDENRWDNNGGKNYRVELSARRQQEIAPIKAL
jgi:alpha-glucan, water dikinase